MNVVLTKMIFWKVLCTFDDEWRNSSLHYDKICSSSKIKVEFEGILFLYEKKGIFANNIYLLYKVFIWNLSTVDSSKVNDWKKNAENFSEYFSIIPFEMHVGLYDFHLNIIIV